MRLLYLTHSCPYPPNRGDRIRSFNILKHLGRKHEVTLIYPSYTRDEASQVEALSTYCTAVKTVRMNPLLAKLRCLSSLATGQSLTLAYFACRRLRQLVADEVYDAVLVDCSSMAQYVLDTPGPKLIDFVDIDSDKWGLYSKRHHWPYSWLYNIEHQRLCRYEQRICETFDACFVVSETEKRLLPDTCDVVVMPNGIDVEYFSPRRVAQQDRLIFTGVMNYFANVDGVQYFHRDIFPLVKQRLPHVQFVIAGMHPLPEIQRLAGSDTIVTGYVQDMRDHMAQAAVAVVPLRIAKGLQNKVLEAMAMELPVVATPAANQGIGARHGKEILLADSPQAFAEATVTLLTDTALRARIIRQAKQFVCRHFRWEEHLQHLDAVLSQATYAAQP